MSLVTLQRSSPGPQCSNSNSDGEADDDEGNKNEKSERYFAGKGTALVLALKDIPHRAERRLSTDSTRSTNSTQSNNSDIQQHLQSMFSLLRPEETLMMAVKLESQRPNRTRYLVIVSRCCYRASTTDRKSKIMRNNSTKASVVSATGAAVATTDSVTCGTASTTTTATTTTARSISLDANSNNNRLSQQSQSVCVESSSDYSSVEGQEKRLSASMSMCSNRQSVKCDAERNTASGDSKCIAGTEESCLLGIDCNERTTIGLVVPILADTTIHLDGDGGFSVSVYGKTHIFKPVSVQAMWSALQTLHKVSQKARENNFYPGGPSHDWLSYYESHIESDQSCLNEWNAMDALESRRPPSPDAIRNKPTAKEETESVIKMKLKEIMMSVDLDEVTSKYIRGRLEEHLDMDLGEYKSFIDEEMLTILGQMDAPTEIFEHVYLGSEWNASNLEELQKNGVRHILNVTREIDNFFPGMFDYFNVRVYDDEKTDLLKHWDNTYRYITRAKAEGSKVLVHCKMGVSRSASVVIAYAMKAYNWKFEQALQHVKGRRSCIKPNKNFLNQLETYCGMLDAMKNKEKLQRSKSETNLKSTKDARLLPGSEPTPLIQALNQSKSKSAGHGVSGDDVVCVDVGVGDAVEVSGGMVSVTSIRNASDQKQRRVMRRSSSTSPKSIQNNTAIVMKQQSQSLENLTPERSVADEPKNMRFPGSNGENYSVTQNQVLHIQKNTPPPPPPPPPAFSTFATQLPPTSVRTIVHDLETSRDARKGLDERKTLSLQFGPSVSHDACAQQVETLGDSEVAMIAGSGLKSQGSPVWTSSSKLITQTSNLNTERAGVSGVEQDVAAERTSSSGIVVEALSNAKLGSNSSIDSASSSATMTTSPAAHEGLVRTRPRQRELPSRHASWGSGDNRCGMPMRNSSWNSYDTNRNTFQYGANTTTTAIYEGQIHELNMSNKTASNAAGDGLTLNIPHTHAPPHQQQHMGTVKRSKQKLEESAILKKLCSDNADGEEGGATTSTSEADAETSPQKRSSNLYRSASAAGSTRSRYPNRCNSEEIMPSADTARLLQAEGAEDQRISGNVQILKKNFEAKAGATSGCGAAPNQKLTASGAKKGHQSLPSSPVAQHVDHHHHQHHESAGTNVTMEATEAVVVDSSLEQHQQQPPPPPLQNVPPAQATLVVTTTSSSSSSSSSASELIDRNVKGLVHKYQTTTTGGTSATAVTATTTTAKSSSLIGKSHHDFSDSRPPPAPLKPQPPLAAPGQGAVASTVPLAHSILMQPPPPPSPSPHSQQQQRRLQQHGKTHPLTVLSIAKQSLNAAAYNTIFFRMLRSVSYSFNDNKNCNNANNNNNNINDTN